ncbi:MAG TPA: PQQ-dependent sugar dehydrogenase, partial [Actinomycetes bacterium]|nr:PQQ-dependent sugar dehydrogenase [Actinomycetes bacterium]
MSESAGSPTSRTRWVIATVVIAVVALVVVLWVVMRDEPSTDTAGSEPSISPSEDPSETPTTQTSQPSASNRLPTLGTPRDLATDLGVPWGVAFLPDGSALVSERATADVVRVTADGNTHPVGTVPGVTSDEEGGLLGIAVSSSYADDHLVYAYFTTAKDNRIVAMKQTSSGFGKPKVILEGIPRAAYHDGGRLMFGPDGMLYATTGDHLEPDLAQNRNSLAGKILRITPDGDVPDGNPFPDSPVWSYGHRNVQGLAFDDEGRLWATEFGNQAVDELNLIKPGANYGWPAVEGDGGASAQKQGFTNPQLTWPVEEASPSGLAWLDGVLYMGALRGERLWQIPVSGNQAQEPK